MNYFWRDMKVGIPRAMLFYEYYPLWKTFFENLGAEVILSDKTTKDILNDGIKSTVNDACLPLKLYHGAVINLIGKVDYIFIPRLKSVAKGEYICPKFCGLPDMIRYSVPNLPTIIDTEINVRKKPKQLTKAFLETGMYITKDKKLIKKALEKALFENALYLEKMESGILVNDILDGNLVKNKIGGNNLTVAVMGHMYNVYDDYVNMNLFEKLRKNNVDVITSEGISAKVSDFYASKLPKKVFWSFARKLIGSASYLAEENKIDGVIYIMSFGCGIDSFVADICERTFRQNTKTPFFLMMIDEHSGQNGFETRLEAFLDMIKWRNKDESNLSPHGERVFIGKNAI
jgi:predicted nucleotide-binding protein (sugar kinase/HSP70/actin superfamily)